LRVWGWVLQSQRPWHQLNLSWIRCKRYAIHITDDLVQAFLKSMKLDLIKSDYNSKEEYDDYIYDPHGIDVWRYL
jgi:phytoene/squalene synthetase